MPLEPLPQAPVTASQPSRNSGGSIIGLVIGLPLGWYAGLTLMIPLGLSVLIAAIVSRALPSRKAFLVAASLIGGHVAWMILGIVLTQRWVALADVVFLGAGLIWLLWRPGLGATLFLGICHMLQMVYSGYLLSVTTANGPEFKAHVVHFVIYAASVVYLITGYIAYRKTGVRELDIPVPNRTLIDSASDTSVAKISFKIRFSDMLGAIFQDAMRSKNLRYYAAGLLVLGVITTSPFSVKAAAARGATYVLIGVPVFLIVWIFFLRSKEGWGLGYYEYSITGDSLVETYNNSVTAVNWSDIKSVESQRNFLLVYLKGGGFQMIPKKSERVTGDIAAFERELLLKTGKSAEATSRDM